MPLSPRQWMVSMLRYPHWLRRNAIVSSGQELSEEDGKLRADLASDAKFKELEAQKSFEVSEPFNEEDVARAVVNS